MAFQLGNFNIDEIVFGIAQSDGLKQLYNRPVKECYN